MRSLYASRARRTDQAVQHYGSEPTPKISPHPNAVQLFRGGEIANPRTSTRQIGQISHWCHRSNPAKTVVASTSRRAIHLPHIGLDECGIRWTFARALARNRHGGFLSFFPPLSRSKCTMREAAQDSCFANSSVSGPA